MPLSPYVAGVRAVAVSLGAERAEAPRVPEDLGGGLEGPVPAPEIVLGVAVEVPAEPGQAPAQPRGHAHVHAGP